MLQMQRMIEKQNPKSGCWELDRLENVGPQFEKGSDLYNYVKAVLPNTEWWNLQVAETFGDLNEYGLPSEREVIDLAEWMEKWECMTVDISTTFTAGDLVAFHARGKQKHGAITSIHLDGNPPFAVVLLHTKAGRLSQRKANLRFVALSALRVDR